MSFQEIELIRGTKKVTFSHIGRRYQGDYEPDRDDPMDETLLRFSCYETSLTEGVPTEWIELEKASYCTHLTVETPFVDIAKAASVILEVLEEKHYKKYLEELSWLPVSEFEWYRDIPTESSRY